MLWNKSFGAGPVKGSYLFTTSISMSSSKPRPGGKHSSLLSNSMTISIFSCYDIRSGTKFIAKI